MDIHAFYKVLKETIITYFKEDITMEIVKAFENNELNIHITIQGTYEQPLFRASDIGAVLGLTNIHATIKDFDPNEKVINSIYTLGGKQDVTFLTESGLYEMLFKSRKPIAKKFKNWVCDVIKEIRLNGSYELKKQLEEKEKQLEEKDKQLVIKDEKLENFSKKTEKNLLTNYSKKPIVYIGFSNINELKFGETSDPETRIKDHKREIKSDFTFEYVYESIHNLEIEKQIKQHPEIKKRRITKNYNNKTQTELIQLDSNFTIKHVHEIIVQIKKDIESADMIESLRLENAELKIEIQKLKEETTNTELFNIQSNSMEDLDSKVKEIKKAVCYNFLADFVAKEIINNDFNTNFEVKLTNNEILEKYKHFRVSNSYQEPIYNDQYENTIIAKAFKNVDGIDKTYKTIDGETVRAKIFYMSRISLWICENLNVPKRFRSIFRDISKDLVSLEKRTIVLNKELSDNYKNTYSFLINLIKDKNSLFVVKNTIITEEYLRFVMNHDLEKMKIGELHKILLEVPGVTFKQRIKDDNSKCAKGLTFDTQKINKWIKESLELRK